ncbi:CAP-Gly Cytoskeleton-associated protein [Spraguea lophii 42_110]|uniref:CAP-Gly Cytoskeleton-associated protein n=1 Tax=Spraguea lophii (strain 42_110) TaxID=1358809 RepID=S7XR24_SPRLO|nr:CAP-Gly Cytoskeleton-associated protein [Spraguea lophii 42_110]
MFQINDSIAIGDKYVGTIRYIGRLRGKEGEWVGIALTSPVGTNDGCYNNKRYFNCKGRKYGLFARKDKLKHLVTKTLKDSLDRSDYTIGEDYHMTSINEDYTNEIIPVNDIGYKNQVENVVVDKNYKYDSITRKDNVYENKKYETRSSSKEKVEIKKILENHKPWNVAKKNINLVKNSTVKGKKLIDEMDETILEISGLIDENDEIVKSRGKYVTEVEKKFYTAKLENYKEKITEMENEKDKIMDNIKNFTKETVEEMADMNKCLSGIIEDAKKLKGNKNSTAILLLEVINDIVSDKKDIKKLDDLKEIFEREGVIVDKSVFY